MPAMLDMAALFGRQADWISQLIACIAIGYTVCVFGVVFGKMGRSPYWGLVFTFPLVGTIMLWTFGLGRWPQEAGNKDMESGL